jgi:alkylation response protein AidB-like acyl-CoA dehydrogenase
MARDVEAVLSAIAEAADGPIAAEAARVDRERAFPATGIEALGAGGGLGLVVGVDAGGAGGGLTALATACERVGEACASTGMVFLMHSVTAATLGAGRGAKADEVLRSMAEGRMLGSLAFSERGTGAHFYSPELPATRQNTSVTVSGRKSFVTSGGHADVYLLLLQGAEDGTADAYLVGREQPGLRFEGEWAGLGMAGNSSVGMELSDVEVGEDALVGEAGKGLELVFAAVAPFFLVGLAAVNAGIAAAAAKAATRHAAERRYPDGTSLAEVQYVQHLLADMDLSVRTGRLLVQEAARLGDTGDESALVAIMEAKVAATRRHCRSSATCAMRGRGR